MRKDEYKKGILVASIVSTSLFLLISLATSIFHGLIDFAIGGIISNIIMVLAAIIYYNRIDDVYHAK